MFGSTVLNQRQHVGLQRLMALAGVTHSSLGPSKRYKFIQDELSGESSLVCSCFRILENLELTCTVGQLVYETIQAHQKVYHSGSGCLLFLAGAWSGAALVCLQRGVSVPHITSALSEGMEVCLDVCRTCKISTEGLVLSKKPIVEASCASSHLQRTTGVITGGQRKINLRHSRHLCAVESGNVSTGLQQHSQRSKHADIAHIAEALSHGCVNAMNLVVETSQMQSKGNQQDVGAFTFDVTKVMTCVLPGIPEEDACVLSGCVLLVSNEQASVAQHLKEQHLNVAVITGDLTDTYHHLGFKRPTGIQYVSDHLDLSSLSKEEEWVENVMVFLLKLDVNLILVSGVASRKLIQCCCRHFILIVDKMKVSVLKALGTATGAVPVSYATQLSKYCVGAGASVVIWRDHSNNERKSSVALNISTAGNSGLVTAVITSCVYGKLQVLEDQFWACAYRLHHALRDRAVLPGAGITEVLCIQQLVKKAERHMELCKETNDSAQQTKAGKTNPYTNMVLQLMAEGLIDYISTVMVNTGRVSKVRARTAVCQQVQNCNGSLQLTAKFSQLFLDGESETTEKLDEAPVVKVYDNVCVKQETWRKALDLVMLVLQTDAEVITGVDNQADVAQTDLMFL
ncbi:chaperonin-containing T-complex member BBS12 [Genypterus blacodes]|uniref:chaperonin-containing T-complex member BBS12 n=1 Tax=Genypterus blacodes TaxID=154954 RepID=UPI003F75B73A